MITEKLKNYKNPDIEVKIGIDLTPLTTLRLKATGHLAIVRSVSSLKQLNSWCQSQHIPCQIIGWGANTLLKEDCRRILLVKLDFPFEEEKVFAALQNSYYLPASVGLNTLIKQAKRFGLKGWEVLTGIPASLGGALFMNAGTKYGDIATIVEYIDVLNLNGSLRRVDVKNNIEQTYAYRKNLFLQNGEIIIGASIYHHGVDVLGINQKIDEYLDYRKRTQPLASKNCGCVFKNPLPTQAGKLIDEIGLKGLEMGGLRISSIHANFIENKGGATYSDFMKLVERIKDEVLKKKQIKLEMEVQGH